MEAPVRVSWHGSGHGSRPAARAMVCVVSPTSTSSTMRSFWLASADTQLDGRSGGGTRTVEVVVGPARRGSTTVGDRGAARSTRKRAHEPRRPRRRRGRSFVSERWPIAHRRAGSDVDGHVRSPRYRRRRAIRRSLAGAVGATASACHAVVRARSCRTPRRVARRVSSRHPSAFVERRGAARTLCPRPRRFARAPARPPANGPGPPAVPARSSTSGRSRCPKSDRSR